MFATFEVLTRQVSVVASHARRSSLIFCHSLIPPTLHLQYFRSFSRAPGAMAEVSDFADFLLYFPPFHAREDPFSSSWVTWVSTLVRDPSVAFLSLFRRGRMTLLSPLSPLRRFLPMHREGLPLRSTSHFPTRTFSSAHSRHLLQERPGYHRVGLHRKHWW